jgi:iron(III) transport system permease protein
VVGVAEGALLDARCWRVTLPICTPALVDIARYFFVNAMTTISAVVFLYSPETKVASIAILNLDEAGETRRGRCHAP